MTEKRTTVVLEAQTRGLDKAARETKGVRDSLQDLGNVAKTIIDLEKALSGTVREFKAAVEVAKEFNKQLEKGKRNTEEMKRSSRGFFQGMAQGAGIGEFFSDQHGLSSQIAGRSVGGMMRGAGSALGSGFTGIGGMTQGLASIPVVGGFMAGQLGQAAGNAGAALAFQQAQAQTMMFGGRQTSLDARGMLGGGDGFSDDLFGPLGTPRVWGEAEQANREVDAMIKSGRSLWGDDLREFMNDPDGGGVMSGGGRKYKLGTMDSLSGMGTPFGMDLTETRGFMGQLLQMAGGNADQLNSGNLGAALGASTRYGIGADVSGAFMRGGRMGAGNGDITDAIKQGVSLGLEGSDLTNYTRDMARLLMDFEQTGMPISGASVRDMAAAAMGTGVFGGERARSITSGLVGNGRRIASSGIGSAADFTFLRDFGGFKGGGAADYLDALEKVSGDLDPRGLEKMVAGARGFGNDREGKAKGAMHLMSLFQQYGAPIGAGEARGLIEGDSDAMKLAQNRLAEAGARAAGVDPAAQGHVGGNLQRQAGIRNRQIGSGQQMLDVVQDFEDMQTRTTKAMSALFGQLTPLTEKLKAMSEALPQNPEDWRSIGAILKALVR